MVPLDMQLRVIRFLLSRNDRAQFIAQHVQQRGYGDPSDRRIEVGMRERVAYIVMADSESNESAKAWSIESDAEKLRIEAIEAELLAEAFQALSTTAWRALIDACASGPDDAYALAIRWKRALDELPANLFPSAARR